MLVNPTAAEVVWAMTSADAQTLFILQGAPGSGKSTLARRLLDLVPNLVVASADDYFVNEKGQYVFDATLLSKAHGDCRLVARGGLVRGSSVVVDNTNIFARHAAPYVEMAAARGIPIVYIRCTGEYGNVHGVPEDRVKYVRSQMEELTTALCLEEIFS
jgi:predicted kinase